MKTLLLRFWCWLGRLLGQDTKTGDELRATEHSSANGDGFKSTSPPSEQIASTPTPAAPVTLPPPLPPQLDIHAGEAARFGRKASILTQPEGRVYRALLLAAGDDYAVMAKVRLWDIIWLVNEPPERKQHLSRLSCRHVDFLLCEPQTLKPVLGIELDDRSHKKPEAIEADRYKDELFFAAGLPLLRLGHPNLLPQRLRETIARVLEEWK